MASVFEWLYPSRPVRFEAPGSVTQAMERLRGAVKRTALQTPFRESLVGRVSPSRVVLRRHRPWIRNDFGPTFVGRFVQRGDMAVLEGSLTLHPLLEAFMMFVLSSLSLLFVVGLVRVATRPAMGDELVFLAGVLGAAVYSAGLLSIGRWLGRKDVAWIEFALATALGASVVRPGGAARGGSR